MSVELASERETADRESIEQTPGGHASAKGTRRKTKRTLAHEIERRVLASFLAFVFYVLAIGPLYWRYYDAKFNEGHAVLAALYEPLYWLCDWCRPFGRLVDAYVYIWIA